MKKFILVLKILLAIIFTVFIGFSGYQYFKLNNKTKSQKLSFASHPQGSIKSQLLIDELIQKYPDFDEAYFEKSVAYNKRGNFAKGFETLNKAVELKPNIHLGYRAWLRLRKLRDYDNALKDFDVYDLQTPNQTDYPWGENLHFLKGECYFGKQEYQLSINQFNLAIKTDGETADIHNYVYLGLCYKYLGNIEEAINNFNRALENTNKTCEADYNLAKIYYENKEFEQAKSYIDNAEENVDYKREDSYNEFLNEIYLTEILALKNKIEKEL